MNNDGMSIEGLRDKYERITAQFSTIFYGQIERISFLGWNKDIQIQKGDDYYTQQTTADNGNSNDMPQRAQIAFLFLLSQAKTFNFSVQEDFITFEALFYKLLWKAYKYQRYSAQSEKLIDITAAEKKLDEKTYKYLSIIYEIMQIEYKYWLNDKDKMSLDASFVHKINEHCFALTSSIGTQDYWQKIYNLASAAHDLVPIGELANRMMLISETRFRVDGGKYIGPSKDVGDPFAGKLLKYCRIRKTFISDCFSNDYADPEDDLYSLCWLLSVFPYLEDSSSDLIAPEGKIKEDDEPEMEDDELEMIECYDTHYNNIMMYPSYIHIPNAAEQFFSTIANLEQGIEKIGKKNEALEKAQQHKKQIIAEFAHTYGNMQATTLHDVGELLLRFKNNFVHECGRKILVEYAIKQNLTKEIEILKLQFEERPSELLKKIRGSISNSNGKNVTDLVSDAFQRCFMSILYGETQGDNSKRELFWGAKDYEEQREALQDAFDQDVLVDEENMLSWLCRRDIIKLSVDVSENWQALRFEDGEYAALLITNWIAELLTNALKYADKSKPISLSFTQQDGLLLITIQNVKEAAALGLHGNQEGVSSIAASLTRFNQSVGCEVEVSHIINTNTAYQLTLTLSEKVLFAEQNAN